MGEAGEVYLVARLVGISKKGGGVRILGWGSVPRSPLGHTVASERATSDPSLSDIHWGTLPARPPPPDMPNFKGFVMSDWGATHDPVKSAKAGLDMEMQGGPGSAFSKLASLVANGTLQQRDIDEKVVHVLTAMYAVGQFDGKFPVPSQYLGQNLWDLAKANPGAHSPRRV